MKMKQIVLFTLFIALSMQHVKTQTYDKLWKQVEQAQKKGLIKSAQSLTIQIFDKASIEKNAGQMLKAYVTRMEYQDRLTPDSFYVNLQNLQQWEATTVNPTDKAVLNSLIMEYYSSYTLNNSHNLYNRTPIIDEESPNDIRLWTMNQFAETVLARGLASIQNKEELLKTSSDRKSVV